MPPDRRPREFLFEPARYKNDPAVMRMSPPARGLYIMLFCEGWDMPEVGVFPDDDVLLAMLARTDLETWLELRNQVATAYDTVSRPGFWVQKGTVETYESQKLWIESKIEAGRRGGLASGKVRRSSASSSSSSRLRTKRSGRVGVGGVGVGRVLTEKQSEKSFDSVLLPDSDTGNGAAAPVPLAAGIVRNSSLKPTIHPDAQAQIEAMHQAGLIDQPQAIDETHFENT